ncbi:MAG: DUF2269 family protein [Chloroflexota bacterium]
MDLFPWILWLHIFGAIVAFGPTFAFSVIGGMGGKEPMHANFATRVTEKIERGIVLPLAAVQGLTGLALLLMSGRNLTVSTNYWLGVAIVLYLIALGFSYFGQLRRVEALVHLSSTPPPAPASGVAPSGPPPALLAAVKAVQQGGIFLTVMIVSIIFLMVVKPGS